VATTLTRMEQKRLVGHRVEGRQFVYRALLAQEEARRSMVGDLADRLFAGDVTALVSHLLEERAVAAAELERLRALIDRKKKEARGGR
jgi:predicted transcriptional regulator